MLFLEDASIAENQDSYEVIRQHTTTPLAIGESYNTIWDCRVLVQNQLIDYIRMAVCLAVRMHLDLSAPNFGIQEFVSLGDDQVFSHNIKVADGMATIDDAPGLGVEFDEEAASQYPYKRSYLPVCRLEDGTLWNW